MKNDNPLPGVPLVESPLFSNFFNSKTEDQELCRIAKDLNENGYAIIKKGVLPNICDMIIDELSDKFDIEEWRRRVQNGVRGGVRIQDAWKECESVRGVANSPDIIELVSRLYGRQAFPFQTLNFPVGTEQHFHTDSMHFSSYPQKFMVGVWIALEDISMDQGPLVYYPKTHKLPVFENIHFGASVSSGKVFAQERYESAWREIVKALDIEPVYFEAKKGDMLIWAANLLHGGYDHHNLDKTRWSQVTHYFFENCMYYRPMHSDFAIGAIELIEPIDQTTGDFHTSKFLGIDIPKNYLDYIKKSRSIIVNKCLPKDFDPTKYLELNSDVKNSGTDPTFHYLQSGIKEGRKYK